MTQNLETLETLPGNTKTGKVKRITPSKRWSFTFNNYKKNEEEKLLKILETMETKYIYGFEKGEKGTPHLQGYVEFKTKVRPIEKLKEFKQIHWEKSRGNRQENIKYCSKDGNFKTNFLMDKPVRRITELKAWQQEIMNIVNQEPDIRTVYWYWEENGNVGKTAIAKLLYLNYPERVAVVDGKAADMFFYISKHKEVWNIYPDTIIIDCPRALKDYINYAAIEKIKNGFCFSGKYESTMLCWDNPHVFVFANQEPEEGKLSADRLIIKNIDNEVKAL